MKDLLIFFGMAIALGSQIVALVARSRIRGRVGILRTEGVLPSAGHRPMPGHPFSDDALVLTDYRHLADDEVKGWNRVKDITSWTGTAGLLLLVAALLVPLIQSRF